MTKLKNTKKGMAKKALSISLVAAMLATSNVPVWAAEDLFTDGSSAAVEAPVVEEPAEEVIEAAPLSSIVTESDLTVNLTVDKNSIIWGDTATISGSITKKDGGEALNDWNFRWLDESGVSQYNGYATTASDMNLTSNDDMAGKTLTLYIYKDTPNDADFDINTGIKVTVEKRSIKSATITDPKLTYTGFSQSAPTATAVTSVLDSKNGNVSPDDYTVTSTSAVNKGETVTVTVTAKSDSAYIGSISKNFTIGARKYLPGDIIANTEAGQTYQYTGANIEIPTDKVSLKESQSTNNGEDYKLNGNDLSSAITSAATTNKAVGDQTVRVNIDTSKLTNFSSAPSRFDAEEKVTIEKRDLSTNGTEVSVTNGKIETGSTLAELAGMLKFKGTEGTDLSLKYNSDYTITVEDSDGNTVTELNETGTYIVTITAKANGNCTGSQTFDVETVGNVLESATASEIEAGKYAPVYTGSEIKPTKDDLGTLTVKGTAGEEKLQASEWEIVGYTNNTEAATYKGEVGNSAIKSQAYVNINILDGKYRGETISLPFVISPLEVKSTYITVPSTINYNENYTKAEQYNVPVTVTAKDASEKVVKTLTADDFTVEYKFLDGDDSNSSARNELNDKIKATITVKNTNYIMGSTDGKTVEVTASGETKIVAKQLTDSMVVVNPSTYTYTGGQITPSYVVMDGELVLYKKGEVDDKIAEYEEVDITDAVDVGTGKVIVEGLDPYYSGRATGTFTITPADTKDVKVTIADQQYTGRQVRPRMSDITVTLNGNNVTNQFEIASYGTNTEAGKGTVVLKVKDGNKNFTGENLTAEFNIVDEIVTGTLKVYDAKGLQLTDKSVAFDFDGNEKTFVKVLLEDLKKKGGSATTATADDFEIKYADNITGNDGDRTSKGNTAYVYAVAKDGTGFSGSETITTADGTVIKGVVAKFEFYIDSVKFVKENITVTNGTYAGGLPVKPEILIQIGGSTLTEGEDYTVKVSGGDTYTEVTNGKVYDVEITGINGYANSGKISLTDSWGIDKKDLADCDVTVTDGVVSVLNGYLPVPTTEYTYINNGDGTYTVTANASSKNYIGSKTVTAEGQAEDEKPDAPVIQAVNVSGNNATVVLSGESDGATGYDYVISTDRDCINNKNYDKVNKNVLNTQTTFTYTQQGVYYAYCHAWKRVDGVKVFSDWSEAYPFVVSAITPEQPVITSVKKSGRNLTVTWTQSANATTGYDVVMGTALRKVNGETRPVEYGKAVKKVGPNTYSVTFRSIPKGTYYVALHAHNRTSETGVKVFSPWSNYKKVTF